MTKLEREIQEMIWKEALEKKGKGNKKQDTGKQESGQ